MDNKHWALLALNPLLDTESKRIRCGMILERLLQGHFFERCSVSDHTACEHKLAFFKSWQFFTKSDAGFMAHLDKPWLLKAIVEIHRTENINATLGSLLTDEKLFDAYLCHWSSTDKCWSTDKPSSAESEAQKIANVLEPCQVVSFRLDVQKSIKDWMENKSYGGILFRWSEDKKVSNYLMGDVWENQSAKPYMCTEQDYARMISAMMIGLGDYYAQPDRQISCESKLKLGVELTAVTKNAGYVLSDRSEIFIAKDVPWEKLAKIGVLIKK